jgi:hypothetical protein
LSRIDRVQRYLQANPQHVLTVPYLEE